MIFLYIYIIIGILYSVELFIRDFSNKDTLFHTNRECTIIGNIILTILIHSFIVIVWPILIFIK